MSWLALDGACRRGSQPRSEPAPTASALREASSQLSPTTVPVKAFPRPAGAACPPPPSCTPSPRTLVLGLGSAVGTLADQECVQHQAVFPGGGGAGQGRAAGKVGVPESDQAWLVGRKVASGSGGDAGGEGGATLLQETLSLPLWGVRAPRLPGGHLRTSGRRASRPQGGVPTSPVFPTSRRGRPETQAPDFCALCWLPPPHPHPGSKASSPGSSADLSLPCCASAVCPVAPGPALAHPPVTLYPPAV